MDIADLKNTLTKKEVAEFLGRHTDAVNMAIADGYLKTVRLGRMTYVTKASLIAFLEGGEAVSAPSRPIIPGKVKGIA